jgi:NAD(P)-dependent dehydrogenase (short-subunit alcohol dehydrogenase family)
MFSLKDKVALVTGASQGIGRHTALALVEAGAKVVVAARTEEKLATLVGEITAAGGQAFAGKMDVADAEQEGRQDSTGPRKNFGRLSFCERTRRCQRDGLSCA